MAENSSGPTTGLFESISRMMGTLVSIVYTRLELLSIDLEEEREHLFSLLILSLTAVFLLGIGVVLAAILLVVIFWETHRILVLSLLAVGFLVVGLGVWGYMLHKIRTKPRLFSSSLTELDKDREQLGTRPYE